MSISLIKNKFYNICFRGFQEKGAYAGVGQCVSGKEDGLYEFILPNGEVANFAEEDIVSESDFSFVASSKQAFQDILGINTNLNLELEKKNKEIDQLLKVCTALKEKILNPSLDVKQKVKELNQK